MKKLYIKIFILVLIVFIFLFSKSLLESKNYTQALLLPHHLLVEDEIHKIYGKYGDKNIERVVLLAPNHFGYGFNWIQTSSDLKGLDFDLQQDLLQNNFLFDEPTWFEKEHSVYVHYPFIAKYFQRAEFVPIIFKAETPVGELDRLSSYLAEFDDLFFIASIDFTHLETQEVVKENDERTISYLNDWSLGKENVDLNRLKELSKSESDEGIAIDSPESLYVLLKILEIRKTRGFLLEARTSSFTETGVDKAEAMTSHIFGAFY